MEIYWWLVAVLFYVSCVFVLVVLPAAFNVSLGLRDRYVNALLRIFQFGYERIERKNGLNEAASRIIDHNTIDEEVEMHRKSSITQSKSAENLQSQFTLDSICDYTRCGIEAIIEDSVTKRFDAAELPSWNLLTRTNLNYQFISMRLSVVWVLGFFVRYFVFLPVRLTLVLCSVGLLSLTMTCIPRIQNKRIRDTLADWAVIISFRILTRGFSAVVNYHNRENMAQGGGICVANHTSPIDALLLCCDRNYAMVGQMQEGIMGLIQKNLLKCSDHIFFERGEMKDRLLVAKRMREHSEDPNTNPILIFPEGTCINNTSVMMFKKGCFEVDGAVIYPVAIKYNPIFGNAFWNSSKEPMLTYLLNMVTSWAIVCDIWYMPPVVIEEGENAIQFANRVKSDIAAQGGLVDLVWDGGLKRAAVPPRLKAKQQQEFATRLKEE